MKKVVLLIAIILMLFMNVCYYLINDAISNILIIVWSILLICALLSAKGYGDDRS